MKVLNAKELHKLVDTFINKKLDGDAFERLYSDIFDFEDLNELKTDMVYFSFIRELLEHYSSSGEDLKNHSDYYISESQLRDKILLLQKLELGLRGQG